MVDEHIESEVHFFLLPSFSNPFLEHALFLSFSLFSRQGLHMSSMKGK
jgi:hypothetical protein